MKKTEDTASGTEPLEQPGDGNRKVQTMVGQTWCDCGSNDVKYNHRDEVMVCQTCGTYW